MEEQELWLYIQENSVGDISDFLKYLARIGMNTLKAGRIPTSAYGSAKRASPDPQDQVKKTISKSNHTTSPAQIHNNPMATTRNPQDTHTEASGKTHGGHGPEDLKLETEENVAGSEPDPFFQVETDPEILRLFSS